MRLGVIGGTGLVKMDLEVRLPQHGGSVERLDDLTVDTPYGAVPLRCCSIQMGGSQHEVVFLQRHHSAS